MITTPEVKIINNEDKEVNPVGNSNMTPEITNSLEKTQEVFFRETLGRLKKEFNLWKYNLSEDTIKIEYKLDDWWKYTITLNSDKISVEIIWESNLKTIYSIDKEWSHWSKGFKRKPQNGASVRQQEWRVWWNFNNRWWNSWRSSIPSEEIPFDWEKFNKIIDEVIKNYVNCDINIEHE